MTFRLVHESTKSLLGFQAVLKFGQQEFAISCQELIRDRNLASKNAFSSWTYWTARVTVVVGTGGSAMLKEIIDILSDNRSLCGDRCGSFWSWQGRAVSQRKNVSIFWISVLQGCWVHRHPTMSISQWRLFNEVQRTHRRSGMEKSVADINSRAVRLLESSLVVSWINSDEVMMEITTNLPFFSQGIEGVRVFFHGKHSGHPGEKLNGNLVTAASASESVPCHPHDLLRSCGKYWAKPPTWTIDAPPAHLITPAGWVKTAFPERRPSISFQTLSQVL